jgi:hypothetical protein
MLTKEIEHYMQQWNYLSLSPLPHSQYLYRKQPESNEYNWSIEFEGI